MYLCAVPVRLYSSLALLQQEGVSTSEEQKAVLFLHQGLEHTLALCCSQDGPHRYVCVHCCVCQCMCALLCVWQGMCLCVPVRVCVPVRACAPVCECFHSQRIEFFPFTLRGDVWKVTDPLSAINVQFLRGCLVLGELLQRTRPAQCHMTTSQVYHT